MHWTIAVIKWCYLWILTKRQETEIESRNREFPKSQGNLRVFTTKLNFWDLATRCRAYFITVLYLQKVLKSQKFCCRHLSMSPYIHTSDSLKIRKKSPNQKRHKGQSSIRDLTGPFNGQPSGPWPVTGIYIMSRPFILLHCRPLLHFSETTSTKITCDLISAGKP